MVVLVAAAALLLLLTGGAKIRRPAPTATALLALLPVRLARRARAAAYALGAGEVAVGLLALVAPWRVAPALVALLYLGFGGYVARALRAGDAASCGCSGREDTPVTALHLALDLAFGAVGVVAAVAGTRPLLLGGHGAAATLGGVGLAVVAGWLGWLAVTVAPQLVAARRALRPAAVRPAALRTAAR